ncbi:MAG: uracil-DNA glycosylase [Mycoplasma sp.]|nr:uracil-DNA glycosylase [Mycoplasma sp.]
MNWPKQIIDLAYQKLNKLKWNLENITPKKDDVLKFLKIRPNDIKVVILGQDPYPGLNVANGYAFATNDNQKIPLSLKNIFKEIKMTQGYVSTDQTLKKWVDQGVLLLNTSLTTIVNKPLAHKDYWKELVYLVIDFLVKNVKPIWVLWGNSAKSFIQLLNTPIIYDAHPSPLSFKKRKGHTFREIKKYVNIEW